MKFIRANFDGAWIIEPGTHVDERGFFSETWSQREFEKHDIQCSFKQGNMAFNRRKGTLRGLHFQVKPFSENKLVRVVRGAIFDVLVDIRRESPTYGQWQGVELSAVNFRQVYLPQGFAHGYQTLEDDTYVSYEVSELFHPDAARGIRWDDPDLKIQWPQCGDKIISPKDQKNPLLRDL